MSRTYRQAPLNHTGFRRPKVRSQRRQLECLKADSLYCEFDVSPVNRTNRHVPSEYDDLIASSIYEIDYRD